MSYTRINQLQSIPINSKVKIIKFNQELSTSTRWRTNRQSGQSCNVGILLNWTIIALIFTTPTHLKVMIKNVSITKFCVYLIKTIVILKSNIFVFHYLKRCESCRIYYFTATFGLSRNDMQQEWLQEWHRHAATEEFFKGFTTYMSFWLWIIQDN